MSKDERLVQNLLRWFEGNRRNFPWRHLGLDPFSILVSEVMLQKTSANVVQRVYPEFMRKYPNPSDVAGAPLLEIQNVIRPLGLFHQRSRSLKAISKTLVEKFDGKVPRKRGDLADLLGIGRYITNAVLCFAYGEDIPIVDANIARFLGRFYSLRFQGEVGMAEHLWKKLEEILPKGRSREFNWALLDLSSTICKPRKPDCQRCPLIRLCDRSTRVYLAPALQVGPLKLCVRSVISSVSHTVCSLKPPNGS